MIYVDDRPIIDESMKRDLRNSYAHMLQYLLGIYDLKPLTSS
jgi:hypothetical protein